MLSAVKGIYEQGRVRLPEPVPYDIRAKVIVTILEEIKRPADGYEDEDCGLFDDMVGVISLTEDGSERHDQYILAKDK